jgi:hypothetical protein
LVLVNRDNAQGKENNMKPLVRLYDLSGNLAAEITDPRQVEIIIGLGAMERKCRVDLHNEDAMLDVDFAYRLEVEMKATTIFSAPVSELRTDSMSKPRGMVAYRDPAKEWEERVVGLHTLTTVGEILTCVIDGIFYSPVSYSATHSFTQSIDSFDLQRYPLFSTIDLLAKLADNAIWDLGHDGQLRFRPNDIEPDHVITFDHRRHALKVWKSDSPVRNYFTCKGGIIDGAPYEKVFSDPDSIDRYGLLDISLFCRPVTTDATFNLLRDAVLAEAVTPKLNKYFDIFEGGEDIRAGDLIELRNSPLPSPGGNQTVRVKKVEITWDNESWRTRLHLAQGLENASRYLAYLDHEANAEDTDYARRRLGTFELDFSALNGGSHLDAA